MSREARHAQLISWLENQGHTAAEIDKILAKVDEYDAKTTHESIFDSVDSGEFNIQAIIDEALKE